MSASLHQIVYISSANEVLTEDVLLELLEGTRKRNAARKITGILLHCDNNIIEVIEGPEAATKSLFEKIQVDPRHRGVTLISSRPISEREFPEFKMGFKRAQSKVFDEQLPGFTDAVEKGKLSDEEMARLSELVAVFIRTFAKSTNMDRNAF